MFADYYVVNNHYYVKTLVELEKLKMLRAQLIDFDMRIKIVAHLFYKGATAK
jgi:hypothetical protein